MWRNNPPADETENVAKQSAIAKNVNPENPSNNHKMKRLHNSVGRLHNSAGPKKVKRAGVPTYERREVILLPWPNLVSVQTSLQLDNFLPSLFLPDSSLQQVRPVFLRVLLHAHPVQP